MGDSRVYTYLKIAQQGSVALMTLQRPPMNALSTEVLYDLKHALGNLAGSRQAKVVVLTGEGKAFVGGADIGEMKDMDALRAREYAALGQSVFLTIAQLPQPTIAAVNGYALGGGCELAMACDIRIASEAAKFGQPEVNLAVIPGFGGTQRLPRLVGAGRAKEMILTGAMIDAAVACRYGLVNRVVPAGDLLREAVNMGEVIASRGPIAVRLAKQAMDLGAEVDLRSGCAIEADLLGQCFATEDQKEGMQAFLDKRKPQFTGQ